MRNRARGNPNLRSRHDCAGAFVNDHARGGVGCDFDGFEAGEKIDGMFFQTFRDQHANGGWINRFGAVGKLFIDRIKPLKRTLLKGKLEKISKGLVDVDYKMKFPKV